MICHSAETSKMLCGCSAEIQTEPKVQSEEQSRAVRSNKNISIKSGAGVLTKREGSKLTWHSAENNKMLCGYSAEIQMQPKEESKEEIEEQSSHSNPSGFQ